MGTSSPQVTLQSLVVDCTVDLFEAYDIALRPERTEAPPDFDELVLAGIIGFTGDALQGTLVLCGNQALLDAPAFAHSSSEDWLGELANQLLGRIKNQLLGYGVTINLSTPVTMRGSQLDPRPRHDGVEPIHFRGEKEGAVAWFDVEGAADLKLVPSAHDDAATHVEGEMLLF